MRIRTRYRLFRLIMLLGVIVFAVSLYDMFLNDGEWIVYVFLAYAVLLLFALVLYLGYKPVLDEARPIVAEEVVPREEAPTPEAVEEAVEVVEVPRARPTMGPISVEGPHHFRCPYCSNVFALEATHISRKSDFRMTCPYCSNTIRVPKRPNLSPGDTRALRRAAPGDQVLYACGNCGEVLRFTAPRSRLERALFVRSCPHCQSPRIALATAG